MTTVNKVGDKYFVYTKGGIDELLANGFNTRQTDVRPAGSVNTAC